MNDAGGLLREWMHMIIKEVFDFDTGLFQLANTEDIAYKLKWDEEVDEEFSSTLLELFGTIIGKALFEKIPLNSYLNRPMIRWLCSQ